MVKSTWVASFSRAMSFCRDLGKLYRSWTIGFIASFTFFLMPMSEASMLEMSCSPRTRDIVHLARKERVGMQCAAVTAQLAAINVAAHPPGLLPKIC